MKNSLLSAALLAATTTLAVPTLALAQEGTVMQTPKSQAQERGAAGGAVGGAAAGAIGGAIVGGPVGAAIGGAAGAAGGAITGSIAGGLSADDRVYVRQYVVRREVPSVRYEGELVVGEPAPTRVRYYEIEGDNPRLRGYRYSRVNDRYILVDSQNRFVTYIE